MEACPYTLMLLSQKRDKRVCRARQGGRHTERARATGRQTRRERAFARTHQSMSVSVSKHTDDPYADVARFDHGDMRTLSKKLVASTRSNPFGRTFRTWFQLVS